MNIKSPVTQDIPALKALWKAAFGDGDEFLNIFFENAYSPDRSFCAEEKGEIAGALYWFDCEFEGEKISYVYAVATAKKHRGKGVCHKLMEHTHRYMRDNGYIGVVLVPGEKSLFDFYQGMGYTVCSFINERECIGGIGREKINKIDKDRYGGLRREFLPCYGVVQERENLDFLNAQMNLYEGEGYILAGRKNGDVFYCAELLGYDNKIQEIVTALGCKRGVFRTAGEERPFAMWYGLTDNKISPRYFGLAFD